ncbi:hypothetical protein [Konateibacter massiliensis]|uniref:hypothetical protein n=1 Tax=Konateibacter massiliensis TaxID=2002841 RepID=UPI000C1584CE|nr:hypothetical protein [Konateibacter massiliensis]
MKKISDLFRKLLPHLMLIFAVMFITFLILDEYNPMMDFVNNEFSMKLLWAWCILTVIQSVILVIQKQK